MPIPETMISTPVVQKNLRMWSFNIDKFLAAETKKRDPVKGDGNCLFRALTKQLFGTDTMHISLRKYVAEVIHMNHYHYSQFFIPYGRTRTFEKHQTETKNPGVWGTQVELQVASDCYQLPVYVCSPHPQTKIIRWLIFRPQSLPEEPSMSCLPQLSLPYTKNHIQLAHTGCHYDSVISSKSSDFKMDHHDLPGEDGEYEVRVLTSDSDSGSE